MHTSPHNPTMRSIKPPQYTGCIRKKCIGVSAGGMGGTCPPNFTVGQSSRNPCVIRAKHITLIKVDKKNRGLH
jgi:hypothetical protein